jgi:Leucine-rich repeat (LRR) protein
MLWGWVIRNESDAQYELRHQCLKNLRGFPKLREIEVRTDRPEEDLDYIGGLVDLETLVICQTQVTNDGLASIRNMAKLKRLSLDGCQRVSDAGLEHLTELKLLEDLDLSHTRVRGPGLSWLRGLKNLKKLNLAGNRISDADMAHVAALETLEELNVTFTKVSSKSTGQLARLKRLKKLRLVGTDMDASGVKTLKESLPNLEIETP